MLLLENVTVYASLCHILGSKTIQKPQFSTSFPVLSAKSCLLKFRARIRFGGVLCCIIGIRRKNLKDFWQK